MGRQLHEDLPLGSYPDRPSVNQPTSKFYTDLIDICDGEVTLLRTKKSGQVWQMRCWIPKEKRHFKKSLRTKELEEAKSKGRQLYYSMMGKLDSEQRIFTISASELVEKYLDMQQDRVDGGFITEERRYTIRTQCNHFLSFVGHDRKMDTIKRERYKDYYLFRRKEKPNVKSPTLLNERATIGHLYKWSLEQGYITQNSLPDWSEIKIGNIGSRTSFNIED